MTTNLDSMGYRELDPDEYSAFQKRMLRSKGGEEQRAFLAALYNNDTFVKFIEDKVKTNDGRALPTFNGAPIRSDSTFKELTPDQEASVYALWQDIPPRTACRFSFWASVTLEHIRSGAVCEATYLAANGGITESGEERIDIALRKHGGDEGNKAIDACVRTALRRMSGLREARGARSVFVNPTFGRAWWRERIVANVSKLQGAQDVDALRGVVRYNQQYWENLVTMMVSRGAVYGSANVQAALINELAKHLREHPDTPLRAASTLRVALRRISNSAATIELGVLSFAEIGAIISDILDRVRDSHNNRKPAS